jgi:hypothetical protein
MSVSLEGEGAVYLWTKNALEREGFEIDKNGSIRIVVEQNEKMTFRCNREIFFTLKDLLKAICL